MSTLALLAFLTIVIYLYTVGKSTIGWILAWIIISPAFRIGNIEIDSTYIVVIVLFFVILVTKGVIALPPRRVRGYLCMIVSINILYVCSWLLFNRNDPSTMLKSLLGAIKNVIMIWLCFELNRKHLGNLKSEIRTMLEVVAVLNLVFVLFQMTYFEESIYVMNQILRSAEIDYLLDITRRGYYSRYFGVLGYPMRLGLICVYSLAYLVFVEGAWAKRNIFFGLLNVFLGICSASKTFILGAAMVLIFWTLKSLLSAKLRKRSVILGCIGILIICAIVVFFDAIYLLIYNTLGPTFANYFTILERLEDVFFNRFNSSTGALSTGNLIPVIKQNILFGVGCSPLLDERVMDNAPLIILHNGGLFCLLIVLLFYFRLVIINRNHFNHIGVILIILATGMGFETWTSEISAFLLLAILMDENAGNFAVFKVRNRRI